MGTGRGGRPWEEGVGEGGGGGEGFGPPGPQPLLLGLLLGPPPLASGPHPSTWGESGVGRCCLRGKLCCHLH